MIYRSISKYLAIAAASHVSIVELSEREAPQATPAAMTVLDSLELPQDVDGHSIKELSGLAWDADEGLLYAVSDKGKIIHFKIDVSTRKLTGLAPVFSSRFKTKDGAEFPKHSANAEGISAINASNGIKGDTELLVIFENGPFIGRFNTAGTLIADEAVPAALKAILGSDHHRNALESIAWHPEFGMLTAMVKPADYEGEDSHTIHSTSGAAFTFNVLELGKSRVKAIEVLPGNKAMVLERNRHQPAGDFYTVPRIIDLTACRQVCNLDGFKDAEKLVPKGNFEGLTQLSDNLFLMVSDDLFDDHRRTLFVLFESD